MGRHPIAERSIPGAVTDTLVVLGQQIATARLRRRLTLRELAARSATNVVTLRRIEAGAPGTGIGAYAAVLWTMGLLTQLAEVARPDRDAEGEALAAARLGERARSERLLDDRF